MCNIIMEMTEVKKPQKEESKQNIGLLHLSWQQAAIKVQRMEVWRSLDGKDEKQEQMREKGHDCRTLKKNECRATAGIASAIRVSSLLLCHKSY